MAAPGMIQNTQTPCYSKDHISYQNFSETTESLSRFFKNDIFPNSMKGDWRLETGDWGDHVRVKTDVSLP